MTRRLAIIGMGKMGRAIADLAPAAGWDVCATLGHSDALNRESLSGADVAVEFTEPHSAAANIRAAVGAGCPIVVGTTGWYDELPVVAREVEQAGGALLWAPNFSVGVNVLSALARRAGTLFSSLDWDAVDAHIIETHHAAKKDAPSGTAVFLRDMLGSTLGRDVPITSVRTGSVPGTHEILFDGKFEQLALTHVARDRRVFAAGALTAAAWLIGKRGVFTMGDVLGLPR